MQASTASLHALVSPPDAGDERHQRVVEGRQPRGLVLRLDWLVRIGRIGREVDDDPRVENEDGPVLGSEVAEDFDPELVCRRSDLESFPASIVVQQDPPFHWGLTAVASSESHLQARLSGSWAPGKQERNDGHAMKSGDVHCGRRFRFLGPAGLPRA